MSRVKVLEVIRQGQIGGGESHLLDLVTFLDREQFEPVCLSFTDGEMITRLQAMNVKCHVIETQKPFDVKVQREIIELMRREQVQIVHAHGSRAASNMVFPARHLHIPFVYTVHGWSFHDDQPMLVQKARAMSEKLICHYVDRVICVSQSNAETGRRLCGLSEVDVIENGINLSRFDPEGSFNDLRPEFGFAASDFVAGFIARCTVQKAPLDFLEGVRLAHERDARVKGIFVGEGDMDEAVDAYVAEHQMQGYLFRSKFRTDVPDLLHTIDVYCLPSLWEGLSIALLEAMAFAKPIVVTPTDGTRDVIRHESNGLIVPFSRPDALADAILRLSGSRSLGATLGGHARQDVSSRFDARRVSEAVGKIYLEMLA